MMAAQLQGGVHGAGIRWALDPFQELPEAQVPEQKYAQVQVQRPVTARVQLQMDVQMQAQT